MINESFDKKVIGGIQYRLPQLWIHSKIPNERMIIPTHYLHILGKIIILSKSHIHILWVLWHQPGL
jgi:hypothetical protein